MKKEDSREKERGESGRKGKNGKKDRKGKGTEAEPDKTDIGKKIK
jgi:hypothetical protein